jgi:hypothetical protein
MQSVGKHQEVPKKEAAVTPVRGLMKRHWDRNLAVWRRQKPKAKIQVSCESRKRLTVAGIKLTRQAGVAWRRESVVRKIRTHENCGLHKEWTANGIRMTHHAKVSRRRGHDRKGYNKENVGQETQKGRTSRVRRWKGPECDNGIRDQGLKQQLHSSRWIKNLCGRLLLHLGNQKTTNGMYWKTTGQEIEK